MESHLCRQRLCHEKSLILNPLTCHPHSKALVGKPGTAVRMGARASGARDEGVTAGWVGEGCGGLV